MDHSDKVAYTINTAKTATDKALALFDAQWFLSWHSFFLILLADTNRYTFGSTN